MEDIMNDSDKVLRDKINGLKHVPDSPVDKDAAWSKLQMRMDHKPARPVRWYYYGMAASLVLLIALVFIYNQHGETSIASATTTAVNKPHDTMGKTTPAVLSTEVKDINHIKPTLHSRTAAHVMPVRTEPNEGIVIEREEIATAITIQDTELVRPIAVNNKMKVLHINEVTNEPHQFIPPRQESFITIAEHRLYKNPVPERAAKQAYTNTYELRKRLN